MVKHIIALISLILTIWAIWFLYSLDREVNKLDKIHQIIAKSKQEVKLKKITPTNIQPIEESNKGNSEDEEKLKALKEKAGNLGAFEVSPLYKTKCSSCHGVNGKGIIGPKLIGLSKEKILQDLEDFKTGKRKNYVMFGLLNNMKQEDLNTLAEEISTFAEKLKNSNK